MPWRSAPHDGLPNHGLLAMSAALSLSHGVALLLLQGWFLATAGVATTEYVRASALGMALALSERPCTPASCACVRSRCVA